MALGNDEHVGRGFGVDVFEDEDFVVLVNLLRGNLAGYDLAEKTIVHKGCVTSCGMSSKRPQPPTILLVRRAYQ
jgi:hypothetical protein